MSLETRELATGWNTRGPDVELASCESRAVTFAAGTGTLVPGTPLYQDGSNEFHVWTAGQRIEAFLMPDPVTLNSGGTVQGVAMFRGLVRYEDVVLPAGEIQAGLDRELRIVRKLGFTVVGYLLGNDASADATLLLNQSLAPTSISSGQSIGSPTIS